MARVGHKLKVFLSLWAYAATSASASASASAEPQRSPALRAEFMRQHPCPSTGLPRGACPGWQVDHREALICGGADRLDNLQWLRVDEHKAKTRVEVKLCRPRTR